MGQRGKVPAMKLPVAHIAKDSVASSVRPTKADTDESMQREARWRAEQDLRTLSDAHEIKNDKSRMGACQMVAKEQMEKLKKVAK